MLEWEEKRNREAEQRADKREQVQKRCSGWYRVVETRVVPRAPSETVHNERCFLPFLRDAVNNGRSPRLCVIFPVAVFPKTRKSCLISSKIKENWNRFGGIFLIKIEIMSNVPRISF